MIFLLNIWAFDYNHRAKITKHAVTVLRWMYTLQLISYGITELVVIKELIAEVQWFNDVLFALGLILKVRPYYAVRTLFTLFFSQFIYINYSHWHMFCWLAPSSALINYMRQATTITTN